MIGDINGIFGVPGWKWEEFWIFVLWVIFISSTCVDKYSGMDRGRDGMEVKSMVNLVDVNKERC